MGYDQGSERTRKRDVNGGDGRADWHAGDGNRKGWHTEPAGEDRDGARPDVRTDHGSDLVDRDRLEVEALGQTLGKLGRDLVVRQVLHPDVEGPVLLGSRGGDGWARKGGA